MSTTDPTFTLPVFPINDRASQDWQRVSMQVERLHDDFMSQWRQALAAIMPATVEIDAVSMDCKPYAHFVKDAPAFSDIQVYEIEAMQSLCAWSLDVGFVSGAVDSMFGGSGRILANDPQRRSRSPIETGVRRRLLESLATAYESVWQAVHPIRLNPLRQEALLSSLRLTSSGEQVVHARFCVRLNQQSYVLDHCLPLRALDVLQPAALSGAPVTSKSPGDPDGRQAMPQRLQEAPVEMVAMLGELQLTVAQLMSLSIGQVVPFQMNETVPFLVDGVRVVSGRSGTRRGKNAVKVDLSSPVNLQGLKADFVPFGQGMSAPVEDSPTTELPAASPVEAELVDVVKTTSHNNMDNDRHEHQPLQ